MEHDAERDDGVDGVAIDTDGDEAEVREKEGELEAEDARDVAVKRVLTLCTCFLTLAPERRAVAEY